MQDINHMLGDVHEALDLLNKRGLKDNDAGSKQRRKRERKRERETERSGKEGVVEERKTSPSPCQ